MERALPPAERRRLLDEGVRLLAEGAFFQAHEAFEELWRGSARRERELWQGLAQAAAALVKHERDEPATAISLLAKARSRLLEAGLPPSAAASLREHLDRLSEAVTEGRDLPPAALPGTVAAALDAILARETGLS
jgi:predicted metal-dependent hydrolase